MAFSEYLEELKLFLQLIGENLVLTGPIDEDDARLVPAKPREDGSATAFLASESGSLEKKQVGNFSRHDGDGRPVGGSILKKTSEIPSLPVHVPILGTSKFSLTSERKRAVTVGGGAPKMNRRRLPVVCVRFPKPFQFLAHSAKNSNWRASLKYGRTIYDADYTLDHDQSKRRMLYITPHLGSSAQDTTDAPSK